MDSESIRVSDFDHIPRSIGAGDVIAGRYRIDRVLGEGGMGVVFAATHLELQEPVAIKLMLPSLVGHPESAARFAREARAKGDTEAAQFYEQRAAQLRAGKSPGALPTLPPRD